MARTIKITKPRQKGNWVKRGIGHRVAGRTIRHLKPNMQKVTINDVTYIAPAKDIKTIKKYIDMGMTPDQIKEKLI